MIGMSYCDGCYISGSPHLENCPESSHNKYREETRPTLEDLQAENDGRTRYCCGFLFEKDKVALIRKSRPTWMAGKLNGIGGHIEQGESPADAMVREFREETGAETTVMSWWPFAVLSGENFVVHFFSSYGILGELKTTTDEEIVVVPVSEVTVHNAIPNLTWLIPMGKSIPHDRTHTFLIEEEY